MNRVLILFAHPALQKSRINRVLISAVQDLDSVTFHDLYEAYPEFDILVSNEQTLMENHDIVILQHPFFWYSIPALLKEWIDLVLEHGWAYGSNGTALQDKAVMNAITTGGSEDAYQKEGHNGYTIREMLVPIEQTFRLCGMTYLPPFVAHGTLGMTDEEIHQHAEDYRRVIIALRDGQIDLETVMPDQRINSYMDRMIEGNYE
jgi:glutathione-regulated potassium-efflux system ancillary protein KefG